MGDLSLKIDYKSYSNFSHSCDVRELHNRRLFCYESGRSATYGDETEVFYKVDLQKLLTVPGGLKKFLESQKGVKKYQFMEAFISFLLQLLHPQMRILKRKMLCTIGHPELRRLRLVYEYEDLIENLLSRELRILLTILGDSPLLLCDDEHEEFQIFWAEFEAVTIEAANLFCSSASLSDEGRVRYMAYNRYPALEKLGEDMEVFINHLVHFKTNIMKFLILQSSISRSAYKTPRTSVVDSLLIVDSLIYDLEDLMIREDNLNAVVKDEIKRFHQWLIVIQSSIRNIGSLQPSEIGELKEPLMRIGDMAYAAEYLTISFLIGDAPLWYLIPRLIDINDKVELIGTEFIEITKKYKSGGLKFAEYFSTRLPLQAKGNTEVDVTVGLEDSATAILDLLVGGTKRLQVVSIFGMAGLGKTTLAKKLYNHPSVTCFFDKLSWCVVSQTYHRQGTLTDILINLTTELGKDSILKMDEESLIEHIYKSLKGRRYLIVMDDIWDSNVWDDLQRFFPDDGNGSRILVTSRSKDVTPHNSIIYALPSLSEDQCWELLEKKAFHGKPCPLELLRIGKKISANCCGLPLAVVVIAGILSNLDKERSTWEDVGGNLASYIFDGGDNSSVMQILELSYKHLPDHLKPCFLYFGAFEEDKEIPARKIMRLWIAEGFVRREEKKSPDDVAKEYLRELIDKSLVMVAKRSSFGGVKSCVIHDLLRDLCLRICEEDKFLKFEMSKTDPIPILGGSYTWSYCQHMCSFRGTLLTANLYARDMRSLRILDSKVRFNQLIGIEYLVNLRYLVVKDLPPSIGNLVNLEYLSVVNCEGFRLHPDVEYEIIYLTQVIVKMRKLRYIDVREVLAKYDTECNCFEPNNLEYLSGIVIGELKDEEMLKCSPRLRKLRCSYDLKLTEKRAFPYFDIRFLTQLDSLYLSFHGNPQLRVLEGFRFPSNIRKLRLSSSRLPWEKMPIIGRLENLEVLKLGFNAFVGERWDTRDGEFQKLKFLKLEILDDLIEWNVDSSQHFPKLQQLILHHCLRLQAIPCEIGDIPTLQLIEVKRKSCCLKSLVLSAQRIQQEQREDMGNEDFRVLIID